MHADRFTTLSPTRRALLAAGTGILSLSLALSIAPAIAKDGDNSSNAESNAAAAGTVKVHDASSDQLIGDEQNDPHVCGFSVVFQYPEAGTSGSWQIVSWPPTGDGSTISSGSFDTTASGTEETAVMSLPAGHYRLEWQADGASNSRNKTFWVECAAPSDEAAPSDDATRSEEARPSDEAAPSDEASPPEVIVPDPTDQVANDGSGNSGTGSDPEGDVQGVNQPAPSDASSGETAPTTGGQATMPDTAMPEPPTGLLTALGLLLIVAAHPLLRRSGRDRT
jgi:hypothetical protein